MEQDEQQATSSIYHIDNATFVTGDQIVHHQVASPNDPTRIESVVRKVIDLLRKKVQEVISMQRNRPVDLQIIELRQEANEGFGDDGMFNRHPIRAIDNFDIDKEDLFQEAEIKVREEAERKFREECARNTHVARYKNIVGVVGSAGMGKTTLAKMILELQHNLLSTEHDYFIFYIPCRNIDFNEKITVFKFLAQYFLPEWEYSDEDDKEILKRIAQSSHVFIIIDGLDEARDVNLTSTFTVANLFGKYKAVKILVNLISGRLLANAKKLATSRPGTYNSLHHESQPHYGVRVIGFTEESQNDLTKQICDDQVEFQVVREKLDANPMIGALGSTPMFHVMVINCVRRSSLDTRQVITVTMVFTSTLTDCVRSERLRSAEDVGELHKLCRMAFNGFLQERIYFLKRHLDESGINEHAVEIFLRASVHLTNVRVHVFQGDKEFYFSHLTWQEFMSAAYLMYFSNLDAFNAVKEELNGDRWEVVVRFMFGLSHRLVLWKLRPLFHPNQICEKDVQKKLKILTEIFKEEFGEPLGLKQIFRLCCFAQESDDLNVLLMVEAKLPKKIQLDDVISASKIAAFCFVLRKCRRRRFTVDFNVFSPSFPGNGFLVLMKTINDLSFHTVEVIRVQQTKMGVNEANQIAKQIPNITDFRIWRCKLEPGALQIMQHAVARRTEPLSIYTVSGNNLTSEDVDSLAGCMKNVNRLRACKCNITGEMLEEFSRQIMNLPALLIKNITKSKLQVREVKLNRNPVGSLGACHLAQCLDKIQELRLYDCSIGEDGAVALASALGVRRAPPMVLIDLSNNAEIGDGGAIALAAHLVMVDVLMIHECGITQVGKQAIEEAVRDTDPLIQKVFGLDNQ